jgi:DNA-directed RNA polymerase subunit L
VEVKVQKRDNQELQIEIIGEGHSFCIALLKDESLEFAGYAIQHPLIGNPVITLRTKGRRRPENALLDATHTLNKTLDELRKTFVAAVAGEDGSTRNHEE